MKTRLAILACALLVMLSPAITLPGRVLAQGSDCAGGKEVTITFMNWWGATREPLMNEVIANFNKVCPNITVVNDLPLKSIPLIKLDSGQWWRVVEPG